MMKKFLKYMKHFIWELSDTISNPFSIDCFGQIQRHLNHMSEAERQETISRIRKKIDNLN